MPAAPALVIVATLLLTPALLGGSVARAGAGPWERVGGLVALFGLLSILLPAAPWPWVGLHTRWIVLVGAGACAVVALGRLRATKIHRPTLVEGIGATVGVAMGAGFGWLGVEAARGRRVDEPAVELRFPLEGGRFVIGSGGSTAVLNGHAGVPAQRYALDIEALGPRGWRAHGLYPAELDAYAVWEAQVVAPCDGEVLNAEDGLPDLPPGDRDVTHIAGNHVVLDCGGVTVLLAHLREETVAVAPQQRVRAGDPIGRVGNTGNTSEPHLHVHAVWGRQLAFRALVGTGEAVPMTFGGRFLVRNDVVAAP
ncbi:MAG: M23 family metallopeptidase [Pseudomonadota bacterium]|nr:M23 family metallopeptidase [Pseudomonadota bacterium]